MTLELLTGIVRAGADMVITYHALEVARWLGDVRRPVPVPSRLAKSEALFEEAQRHLPGGVNSPVRAFKGVGGTPLFIERGRRRIWDADGNEYVDYVGSWGP